MKHSGISTDISSSLLISYSGVFNLIDQMGPWGSEEEERPWPEKKQVSRLSQGPQQMYCLCLVTRSDDFTRPLEHLQTQHPRTSINPKRGPWNKQENGSEEAPYQDLGGLN